jgi:hypothetical protein
MRSKSADAGSGEAKKGASERKLAEILPLTRRK